MFYGGREARESGGALSAIVYQVDGVDTVGDIAEGGAGEVGLFVASHRE